MYMYECMYIYQHTTIFPQNNAAVIESATKFPVTNLSRCSETRPIGVIGVLQPVALCGSVWQCVAACSVVWQSVAVCGHVWQCVAVCYSMLQCIAVCRSACVEVDIIWALDDAQRLRYI